MMKRLGILGAVLGALAVLAAAAQEVADPPPAAGRPVVLLDVKGPIGPATGDYIRRSFEKARDLAPAAVVIRMDTPGGLDTSMRQIIQDILGAPFPVITYVAPSGARAASAGTYILYASHVAAMAPGTNLGAATPIQIGAPPGMPSPTPGGEPDPEKPADKAEKPAEPAAGHPGLEEKMVNDAVAYIRGLARMRGRNVDWAEKAVREAASLPAQEAVEMRVVDLLAESVPDLLAQADGRVVKVNGSDMTVRSAGAVVTAMAPDWRNELLAVITNPNLIYILLLVGVYGLIYEFLSPGAVLPGVVGAICLILALFAMQVLPINYAGLGLIILGIGFIVAEAFVPAFGALGIGGIIALVVGSIMLIDTDAPGFGVSWQMITAVAGGTSALFLAVVVYAVKARRRPVVSGIEQMVGDTGRVADWDGAAGQVRVHGELWRAVAPRPLDAGQAVRVTRMDGLTLTVEPADNQPEARHDD